MGIIGLMVRWFPDRRGLATGLAAAGYGFGAIFTSFPIDSMIKSDGYAHTLIVWGIIQGIIGIIAAQWLRVPPEGWQPEGYSPASSTTMQSKRSYSPAEMLRTPTLAAVHHDEHDVDQRADGRFQCRPICQRI